MSALRRFLRETEAATAVEYALMLALICVVIVATVQLLGNAVNDQFANVPVLGQNAS